MSPLESTASSTSGTVDCSPSSHTGAAAAEGSNVLHPTARRRNNPAQLKGLQELFQITPHPSREQRQHLAEELGLELKSVTNWFQNRRQTARRKSRTVKENTTLNHRAARSSPGRSRHSHQATSKTQLLRAVSLDKIAELSERPTQTCTTVPRMPFTPSTPNVRRRPCTSLGTTDLWKYMPSSPPLPQSSPAREKARLSALPVQAKTFRSLEWACLNARRGNRIDDREDLSSPDTDGRSVFDGSVHTDSKESSLLGEDDSAIGLNPRARSEDVEAAIILLGIKARS